MKVEVYCDDQQEGEWFIKLSKRLSSTQVKTIGGRGTNPPVIERLLRYDRPDIIVLVDDEPKLVVEKTSEVPTGHNVGQRFARLANAVEETVMVVFFLPFSAKKHGKHANVCHIPARFFTALEKMEQIHGVPVLAVNWLHDERFELIRNGSQDHNMSRLVNELIETGFDYSNIQVINELREAMNKARDERKKASPSTARPPASVKILETEEFVENLKRKLPNPDEIKVLPANFLNRKRTLVYNLGMTPQNCRREDPYTGTQFLYDYLWCRSGPDPSDKHTNLVLSVTLVDKKRWLQANPNDPARKSAVYYSTANCIVLKDGIILCESKVGPRSYQVIGIDRFLNSRDV